MVSELELLPELYRGLEWQLSGKRGLAPTILLLYLIARPQAWQTVAAGPQRRLLRKGIVGATPGAA